MDAAGTKAQWLSTLALERTEVGITCYTFDLEGVVNACIGVRARDSAHHARVRIIADEVHTHATKETGQLFARAAERGFSMSISPDLL